MKQEFIHIAFMDNLLKGPSISKHEKPSKLMVMLHGYGDNAANFMHLAHPIDQDSWGMHYISLNAPSIIPGNMMGYQWFDLYPGGVYISEAGPKEYEVINKEIEMSVLKLKQTINFYLEQLQLKTKDCFIIGFSQGGIITYEYARRMDARLGGIAILSGRIIKKSDKTNKFLRETPIFISHGSEDDVLPISNFEESIQYLEENKYGFESHMIEGDTHTISPNTINLFQKFVKKNI